MTLVVNRSVTRLDLTGSRLGEEDVRAAGEALRHPHCALQTLRRAPPPAFRLSGFRALLLYFPLGNKLSQKAAEVLPSSGSLAPGRGLDRVCMMSAAKPDPRKRAVTSASRVTCASRVTSASGWNATSGGSPGGAAAETALATRGARLPSLAGGPDSASRPSKPSARTARGTLLRAPG